MHSLLLLAFLLPVKINVAETAMISVNECIFCVGSRGVKINIYVLSVSGYFYGFQEPK